ncbi:hypothetical protein M2282_001683 [Variovorax boronicumulans]|uniref:DUF6402 family protein n=1 Tax=Variovorax boronicumulans TaxID=436515 RepID=UPI002476DCD8|nr:DUF6402 family protein [Variovorax boronicumulans]MDH6166536.1 hypothetical protein [Variovorax boronicumulans]
MQSKAGERIDFRKSNNFMRSWSQQIGEICHVEVALSSNRAPPPMRGKPVAPVARKTVEVPVRRKAKDDPYANTIRGAIKATEAVSGAAASMSHWLKSPPLPPKEKSKPLEAVPPFDIQDIPGAMRKIGAPLGADLMDKWFAGALNFPPTAADERNGINQNGVPYPPSMIDTTSVKMDWVMKFARAKKGLDHLMSRLGTPRARKEIANALRPYRNRRDSRSWLECQGDIVRFHKESSFSRRRSKAP